MWFVTYLFNLDPALLNLGPAGPAVLVRTIGGATSLQVATAQPQRGLGGAAYEPPQILEPSDRNFLIHSDAVPNRRRTGGALAILCDPLPQEKERNREQEPEEEWEELLLLHDFDFGQALVAAAL